MARERKMYLDCSQLVRGTRHGNKFIHRLRYYFSSRFRGTYCTHMTDEELFAYTYAKHTDRRMHDEAVRTRASTDYVAWVNGEPAPDYMCSWYRTALSDRLHSPVQQVLPERVTAFA